MLAVVGGTDPLESRPMTAAKVEGDRIWMIADRSSPWLRALVDGSGAHVTVSDSRDNTYASLNGTLTTTDDRAVIDELWTVAADPWFEDGKNDPNVTALVFDASAGSYWTAPSGRLGALVSMVRAKLGGAEDAGEHGAVAT